MEHVSNDATHSIGVRVRRYPNVGTTGDGVIKKSDAPTTVLSSLNTDVKCTGSRDAACLRGKRAASATKFPAV